MPFLFDNVEKIGKRWSTALIGANRRTKLVLAAIVDVVCVILAALISFSIRLGYWQFWTGPVALVVAVEIALFLPIFSVSGVYSSLFRFHGPQGMRQLALACALLTVPSVVIFGLIAFDGVPRTVSVLFPLMFFVLVALSRVLARYLLVDFFGSRVDRRNVMIFGAGSAGRQLAASLSHEPDYWLRGFLDVDPLLAGRKIEGLTIYPGQDLESVLADNNVSIVLLAMPSMRRADRVALVDRLQAAGAHVLTLPGLSEIVDGKVSVSDLREIEVTDLLSRDPVRPDPTLLAANIRDKVVLVTGAGGSIGAELVRQIIPFQPARLVLLEMTEAALYAIDLEAQEIRRTTGQTFEIVPELASVEKMSSVNRIFARYRPDTVYHAAAYKHVPLVEANIVSGVTNNILGTRHCAEAACAVGVERFILVSTDKAVRPTNVMGASKRVCEMICQAFAGRDDCSTIFSMVRFGNVLGSSGSVVPRFKRQIADGGPITITHRDITRYFMTIPEAAELVIQAGAMARGGEVYLLDMGEPVKIVDLARTMIRLSGRTVRDEQNPEGDIAILETGLRPGEKLYEELLIDGEAQATGHRRIFQAQEACLTWADLDRELVALELLARNGRVEGIRTRLTSLVPGYAGKVAGIAA